MFMQVLYLSDLCRVINEAHTQSNNPIVLVLHWILFGFYLSRTVVPDIH